MVKKYFFSINLLIKNDTNMKKSIDSVISDSAFFRENVQLILIDLVGSKLSLSLCSQYSEKYPDNILYIDAVGKSSADGYNDAHTMCMGKYISYSDNCGEYSPKTLNALYKILQGEKIPIASVKPMISVSGSETRPYVWDMQTGVIKLAETPDKFILILGSLFFRRNIVSEMYFDRKLKFHWEVKFITQALAKTNSYIFTEKHTYTTIEYTEHEKIRYEPQYSQKFYTPAVRDFIIPMLKNHPNSPTVQSIMMYLINVKFALNQNELYKNVLIGSHVTEFFNICAEAMKYIDDAIILNTRLCRLCSLDEEAPFRFLRLKYQDNELFPSVDIVPPDKNEPFRYRMPNGKIRLAMLSGEFTAHVNGAVVTSSKTIAAEITAVNCDRDGLYVDAKLLNCSCFDEESFSVFASVNKQRKEVNKSNVYTITKFFDVSFLKKYSFKFFIPINRHLRTETASLHFKYGNLSFRMRLFFRGINARISNEIKNSYWHFYDRIMTYDFKNKSMIIRYASESLLSHCESKFISEISKRLGIFEHFYYRRLRALCRKTNENKNGKKIVMFCENSGINYNGNLLFRYFSKFGSKDSAIPYITVKKNSKEQIFLSDSGYTNILEEGTQKAKVTALCADILLAPSFNVYKSLGFTEKDKLYLKDLFNAKIISVKNDFLTYDTAQYYNRLRDNTQMIFCSSQREKENLMHSIYDYSDSMIKVTGTPLTDAVSDKKEKLILIAPGNRRLFGIYENSDFYRFSNSAFFKYYNMVLSDPELLSACRKNGWKIAVLMPNAVEKYIRMFHSDDIVRLYNYSEQNESALLGSASVLVTDYSELQYRFAFLNKSVFYYFPPNLPMKSERSGEKLPQYGFGEIIFKPELLVERLISEMPKGFRQSSKYSARCHEFFLHHDNRSCQRITEELNKILFTQ